MIKTGRKYFIGIVLLLNLQLINSIAIAQSSSKPNVVIILADDLGYGDLQCYNPKSQVPTPNLDRLAAEGMRLTDAYCPVSVCSPTRYSLITGRYAFRSWKKSGVMANYEPSMIAAELLTLPEMMQEAGYITAGFGKWHLGTTFPTLDGENPVGFGKFRADNNGANLDFSKPVSDGPLDHGFDQWLGFSCASECWIFKDKEVMGAILHDLYTIEAAPNSEQLKKIPLEDYLSFITENTLQFLSNQAQLPQKKPFFLYYAPYVPHVPLAVSEKFRGSTEAGLYGDYVHELDHYVGILLNKLQDLKLSENTIVIFASDNGSQFTVTSKDWKRTKAVNNASLNLNKEEHLNSHHPNGKLRGTKWTIYEGGVRTPLIVRWPQNIKPGSVSNQVFALNDVMATVASILNFKIPENSAQDSYDLLSVWRGKRKNKRELVVVQSSANVLGLRWGKWKYIGAGNYVPQQPGAPAGELYDLSSDPSETVNVYLDNPEVVQKMKKKLEEILNNSKS